MFIPGTGAWRTSDGTAFATTDEYKQHLYSPDRLAVRASLFFEFSLPMLAAAAARHELIHIVSFSESLPLQYRDRLARAAGQHDFLRLDERPDGAHATDPSDVIRREFASKEVLFAEYRLDDDDLLAVDFFEQLLPYVRASDVGRYVSLGSGVTAIYHDGQFHNARRCHQPMIAIGLARICVLHPDGSVTAPAAGRHTVADTVAPVVVDSRRLAFLWTRHIGQDTAVTHSQSLDAFALRERLSKGLDRFPKITEWTEIERHFPMLGDRITGAMPGQGESVRAIEKRLRLGPEELHFDLPALEGSVGFEVHVRSASPKGSRYASMILHLTDEAGEAVAPETILKLNKWMTMQPWGSDDSSRVAVRLRTSAGVSSTRGEICLPGGVMLQGVSVKPDVGAFRSGFLERLEFKPVDRPVS